MWTEGSVLTVCKLKSLQETSIYSVELRYIICKNIGSRSQRSSCGWKRGFSTAQYDKQAFSRSLKGHLMRELSLSVPVFQTNIASACWMGLELASFPLQLSGMNNHRRYISINHCLYLLSLTTLAKGYCFLHDV